MVTATTNDMVVKLLELDMKICNGIECLPGKEEECRRWYFKAQSILGWLELFQIQDDVQPE